ncbi:Uncharacterised protein [uncultured archaeon]|nr:Uncharacterised protein [uncultured archaeon]
MNPTEEEKKLLSFDGPAQPIIDKMISSSDFAWMALTFLKIDAAHLEKSYEILKKSFSLNIVHNIQPGMLSHYILEVSKLKREYGIRLIEIAIQSKQMDYLDEIYLSEHIGPLSENEISQLYTAFQSIDQVVGAAYFLSSACRKNTAPLDKFLKTWLTENELFAHILITKISDKFYEEQTIRNIDTEAESVEKILTEHLNSKRIKIKLSRKNFNYHSGFIRYLLALFGHEDFNQKHILENFEQFPDMKKFLPKLTKEFTADDFNHPLSFSLQESKKPNEVSKDIGKFMQAQWRIERETAILLNLWEMNESIKEIMPLKNSAPLSHNLSNRPTYEPALSELFVFKLLKPHGKLELYPYTQQLDGKIIIDESTLNFDVSTPQLAKPLQYGQVHTSTMFDGSESIKNKTEKLRKIGESSALTTPLVIFIDGTAKWPLTSREHIETYLFGPGEMMNESDYRKRRRDPARCIPEEDLKLVSAVILFRRVVSLTSITYTAEVINNPYSKNPLPLSILDKLEKIFKTQITYPLISFFK